MPINTALTRQHFDTRWKSLRRPYQPAVSRQWRSWLMDRGSLTQRLIKRSNGDFRVELVRQGWARPTRSEAKALNMSTRQVALVREVQLIGKGQPWVFARSIIPAPTLTGPQRQLKVLGTQSLGSLLFTDPTMRRGHFQICRLSLDNHKKVWARRSVFFLSNKPLLVSEVFLPQLLQVN